jgi:protein SCO1
MMKHVACRFRALGLLVPLLACASCQPSEQPSATPPPTANDTIAKKSLSDNVKTYRLVGIVRGVDRALGELEIRHEAIPGFMPAMTMPFPVKDRAALDELHAGDEIEGTLRVASNSSELVDLKVTRRGNEGSLKVDLSSGVARIELSQTLLEPGQMVPNFTMTTQEGKTLSLEDLRGHVVVLTFIYTRCPLPDFCPLIDRKFSELAGKLSVVASRAEQVRLLSVSFDPAHDTPEVLNEHARRQGARPPLWTFAVASNDELAKVAPALGLVYWPDQNEIGHNLVTAIIDPEGRLVRLERGRKWEPIDLLKAISTLLPQSRR